MVKVIEVMFHLHDVGYDSDSPNIRWRTDHLTFYHLRSLDHKDK